MNFATEIGFEDRPRSRLRGSLLVALHCKGGHGDHGDRFSSSSSFSHLVTSSPDTSGSWISIRIRSGRCLRARSTASIRRAARCGSRGLEEVVEQLHVELIVLHDQDGLRHFFSAWLFWVLMMTRRAFGVAGARWRV